MVQASRPKRPGDQPADRRISPAEVEHAEAESVITESGRRPSAVASQMATQWRTSALRQTETVRDILGIRESAGN